MIRAISSEEGDPQTGKQASIRIEGSDTWLPALVPVHAPRGSRTPTTSAVPVVGCFVHNRFVLSWADMRCRSTTGASFPAECDGADQRNVAVQDTAAAISFVESLAQEGVPVLHPEQRRQMAPRTGPRKYREMSGHAIRGHLVATARAAAATATASAAKEMMEQAAGPN